MNPAKQQNTPSVWKIIQISTVLTLLLTLAISTQQFLPKVNAEGMTKPTTTIERTSQIGYIPGEILVSVDESNPRSAFSNFQESDILRTKAGIEDGLVINENDFLTIKSDKLASAALSHEVDIKNGKVDSNSIDAQTANAIKKLESAGYIAEPNYIRRAKAIPNDSDFGLQEYLLNTGQYVGTTPGADIKATQAWDIQTGSSSIKIAIVDSGVKLDHPDLAGKLIAGYDFVDNDTMPDDLSDHGTMAAGFAAAMTNNSVGIAGVCQGCSIMPVRVLAADGSGSLSDEVKGIKYAVDNGAKVINLSLGGPTTSSIEKDAINYALERNVTVVASVDQGNVGLKDYVSYPAYYPGVIAVAALDASDRKATTSDYGSRVDISAPGSDIYSTSSTGNGYRYGSGTSYAAPLVSGAVGLLLSSKPSLTPTEVLAYIKTQADNIDSENQSYIGQLGGGRLNTYKSVKKLTDDIAANVLTPDVTPDILWRNTASGNTAIWYMNPNGTVKSGSSIPTISDTAWQIVQVADMDDDYVTDVIWRNSVNGSNAIWYLNANGSPKLGVTIPTIGDTNWKLAGVGTIDADQYQDILWRNTATGGTAIWYMNPNGTVKSGSSIPTISDTAWKIVQVADMDDDLVADVIWRNSVTGANAIWYLYPNGDPKLGVAIPTISDSNWKLAGVGAIDSDKMSDILWRNTATGGTAIWYMNGDGTVKSGSSIPTISDTAWQIVKFGDMDNDFIADVVWRNSVTGANAIWYLNANGSPKLGVAIPTIGDTNWKLAGVGTINL